NNKNDVDTQAAQLRDELIKAPAVKQEQLIEVYKEHKGVEYTQALAGAIPHLQGETKSKARDALAERLTRMTAATLRERLKDDDIEMRRAAALACGMKEDKNHIPDLIPRLEDNEPAVARAAQVALKHLTKEDFGPVAGATKAERQAAIDHWKAWWNKQKGK